MRSITAVEKPSVFAVLCIQLLHPGTGRVWVSVWGLIVMRLFLCLFVSLSETDHSGALLVILQY